MDYSVNRQPLLDEDKEEDSDDEMEEDEDGIVGRFPKSSVPIDLYRGGYLTFYMLGMVTLLPYTFFVTANDYWMYKLRDVEQNVSSSANRTTLQAEFTTYLTIAASGPSVLFMVLNSLLAHKVSIEWRMFGSLITILLSFILTTAFVDIDTDSWQDAFFAITLATVVVVNVFGAILTASLYGIACKFSSRYISAVSSGQALGGMFPAIVYIGALAVGASSTHSASLYFVIANVTITGCLAAYYALTRSLFFQYHMLATDPVNTLTYDPMEGMGASSPTSSRRQVDVRKVFYNCWEYGVSAMLCYLVTISVYPGISVLVLSVNAPSVWTDKYFVPVIAFFVFSLWDYIGRVTAGYFKWPVKRKWIIVGLGVCRVVFVPVFLLCNAHPRANLPVLINSDSAYVAATCLLGFTNGYLTNIILINVPKVVEGPEQEAASSIVATFISIGCALGALLSCLFVKIL